MNGSSGKLSEGKAILILARVCFSKRSCLPVQEPSPDATCLPYVSVHAQGFVIDLHDQHRSIFVVDKY